jgi:hypothetical protein
MQEEKNDLIKEIKQQDKKLQHIAKPFGGYRNILEIDDVHFEDGFLDPEMKKKL